MKFSTIGILSLLNIVKSFHSVANRNFLSSFSFHQTRKLNVIKENGGVPIIPSADELMRQSTFQKLKEDYEKSVNKRIFDDTIKFPSEFTMKIIGTNEPTFIVDTINTIATCVGKSPESLKYSTKLTKGGNYLSITVSPVVQKSSDIYNSYSEIAKDSRVKFML
jgi:putative lipoic acid-binding regulatory protein